MTADPRARLLDAFVDSHPDEVVSLLGTSNATEIAELVAQLPVVEACRLIEHLPTQEGVAVLDALDAQQRGALLARLDVTRSAILLRGLGPEQRENWLASVTPALAAELQQLLSYPPGTAGHLMHAQLVAYPPTTTVQQVLARLNTLAPRQAEVVLVVDGAGILRGVLTLPQVAGARGSTPLGALLGADPLRVPATAPQEDVLAAFDAAHIDLLPVVDGNDRLLGVIHADAVVAAARVDAGANLATLVGASREERALSPVIFTVRKRLPWLNINLLTAFLAAAVVGLFEDVIAQVTALAVLLPVVAGQSGNTGAQALAVVIRGLALREVYPRNWLAVCVKETLAALINGVAIAVVTAAGVYLWSGSPWLTLVIFVAMIMSMVIAGVSGAAIPLLLTAWRQDPAQAGSIVLTTVTDVMGFFSFLGLAAAFASLL